MGKTITLRSFSRLHNLLSLSLFFFTFFFRIGTKMNLLISISILCFVSLVAGTPASGGVKADVAGEPLEKKKTARMLFGSALGARKMDEANRQADERHRITWSPDDWKYDDWRPKTGGRKTARMLFGSALGARKTEEANRQADERLLKDYAKVEISRDNRETCIKKGDYIKGEECSMENDNCCSGLKCDYPGCPRAARSAGWCHPVCKDPERPWEWRI